VSSSEIAFLALGLVLGAAIGAAIVEAVRSRPAPRREVRVTIAPNSVLPRRSTTLAMAIASGPGLPIPGSPEDAAWPERAWPVPTKSWPPGSSHHQADTRPRTRVPSGPPGVSSSAVAVPVEGGPVATTQAGPLVTPPGGAGPDAPSASLSTRAGAVSVLEPIAAPADVEGDRFLHAVDVGAASPAVAVRPRPPVETDLVAIPLTAIALAVGSGRETPAGAAGGAHADDPPSGSGPDAAGDPSADPCGAPRQLAEERCGMASAAREQAQSAADALRDAQRAYDSLRERVERAQADADPRAIAAAKDWLHQQFRAASAAAQGAEATEAAAREWLTRINEINNRARDAARLVDSGSAELRAALPRLDRLSVEADAARIRAETAEAACREARERLAACEEARATQRPAPAFPPAPQAPGPDDWVGEPSSPLVATPIALDAALHGVPAIVRILHGDRAARERVVAEMAAGDTEASRSWHLRLAALVDAISARAIEDGYLDLPDDDPFWGLFSARESREIVGALSALGFRFDGLGGFADERVPAPRDLSLAVGYAGLDRMRIRNWPREADLPVLYARATIAADEWLAHEAGDLSLGEMVDALGSRAGDLADAWNAWGRLRPLLLAAD
jgi:hypothetical protein